MAEYVAFSQRNPVKEGPMSELRRMTLDRPEMVPHLPYPRLKRRHPVVLGPEEARRSRRGVHWMR